MLKLLVTEAYTDNGEHSHWRLINADTGDLIWTEDPEEDKRTWAGYKNSPAAKTADQEKEAESVKFAEWLGNKGWQPTSEDGHWYQMFSGLKTTSELYQIFKQQTGGK